MSAALTILTFHALDDARTVISFPPALFERLVGALRAGGYRVMPLADAAAALHGRGTLPARPLAITFDDGYRSVYQAAFPILRAYALPATVFLAVGDPGGGSRRGSAEPGARLPSMEGRPMLSWGEIREMQRGGITFGAHTLTHPDLTRLPPSAIEREMVTSKAVLEQMLGEPAVSFAYPFGRYDARSLEMARRHFACAVSDRLGFASPKADIHALPRVDAYYLGRPRLVDLLATPWFPGYILACSLPRNVRRGLERLLGYYLRRIRRSSALVG
jgi:peptidoglycan/xylan/chitin deacetylase (PgdA/CDA1 family)